MQLRQPRLLTVLAAVRLHRLWIDLSAGCVCCYIYSTSIKVRLRTHSRLAAHLVREGRSLISPQICRPEGLVLGSAHNLNAGSGRGSSSCRSLHMHIKINQVTL